MVLVGGIAGVWATAGILVTITGVLIILNKVL